MRTKILERALWVTVIPLLALGAAVSSERSERVFYVVEEEVVEPALAQRYETGVRILVAGMRRSKLGPELGWTTAQRGQSYFYVFTVRSLDELDPRSPVTERRFQEILQGVGDETAKKFGSMTVPSPVRSVRMFVLEPVEEFSYRPARPVVEEPKLVFQEFHRVRHDMVEPYKAVIRRMLKALHKASYPIAWTAYRSVLGEGRGFFGEGRYYYYVAPFDRPSQIYQEHAFGAALEKALGKEGAQELLAEEMKCLEGFEQTELKLRPDMSPN